MHAELLIYVVHGLFWATFGVVRLLTRARAEAAAQGAPAAAETQTAPNARLVLVLHSLAFGAMYFGIGAAAVPNQVPTVFAHQRVVGTLVIALGSALTSWALLHFASWRLRAQLDAGHRLVTDGPFALVRHPLYLAFDLLALGSALWIETPIAWAACALMIVAGDLRSRAEENLLTQAFGTAYTDYCTRTRRLIPGLY